MVNVFTILTVPGTKPLDHLNPRYSAQRVARIFNISRRTLQRWVDDGLIAAVKISPHRTEFEVEEVERRYLVCRGGELPEAKKNRTDRDKS